jgi:hypothetical protein
MIVYDLTCAVGHRFESWFPSGAAFDAQQESGAVECPFCGNREIGKAPMAPRVARGALPPIAGDARRESSVDADSMPAGAGVPAVASGLAAAPAAPAAMFEMLQRLRQHIEHNCDYVGAAFPEEARRIFYGESERRDIFGEASAKEAAALKEEGIEAHQIPWLPRRDA